MFDTRRAEGRRGSRRSAVLARNGMVCTSQPLASFAAADLLRRGGNAIDAAVCAAAVLGVVEPFSTGIGGDCFLLLWHARDRRLYGLNGSGRAPRKASIEALRERGLDSVPSHGPLAVTVPGAVDAWCTALERFGSQPRSEVLAAAIDYARNGFPVTEIIAHQWRLSAPLLQNDDARRCFTSAGDAPHAGQVVRLVDLARSLEIIAAGGAEAFYRGELASAIVRALCELGGWHQAADFAEHGSTWVEPIATDYRGATVHEIPPNGQGLAALVALNILECFDIAGMEPDAPELLHLRIEAVKLAYADRARYIADPDAAAVPVGALLSKDYAQGRAALIQRRKALKSVSAGSFPAGLDTVYLTAADAEGNVVSLINSLFFPFGSGIVAGRTGIALQNRGFGFSADPSHPNCLAPGKRPFHTIIPAMITRGGKALVSFGVMGGDMQAQAHVQVVSNLIDSGYNIQEALDAPRFHYLDTDRVALEHDLACACEPLRTRGHVVEDELAALARGGFGGGQGIAIDPATGVYWGGSDWRKDGCAVGF